MFIVIYSCELHSVIIGVTAIRLVLTSLEVGDRGLLSYITKLKGPTRLLKHTLQVLRASMSLFAIASIAVLMFNMSLFFGVVSKLNYALIFK